MKRFLLLLAVLGTVTARADETPKSVTLDVKDEDVRVILKAMQQQCGIKNLLIDKEVAGKGTILFNEVSCPTAFRVVMMQFGLSGTIEPNIMVVEPRKN